MVHEEKVVGAFRGHFVRRSLWLAYDVEFVEHGVEGEIGCVGSEGNPEIANDQSYAYCGPDATIYVGQATVWQLYHEQGDAVPAVGITHELGHHVQATEGAGRDHGTLAERVDSFRHGYENGLPGCSEFYPSTPLLTR